MPSDDRDYFRERAEAELEAAMKADHPDAARAHYLLAGYYLDRAYNPAARSSPPYVARQARSGRSRNGDRRAGFRLVAKR